MSEVMGEEVERWTKRNKILLAAAPQWCKVVQSMLGEVRWRPESRT